MTQIFFITNFPGNALSFPDPGDWDVTQNKIECIGGGGQGGNGGVGTGGSGGGGGTYAFRNNVTLTFPVAMCIKYTSGGYGSGNGYATTFGNGTGTPITSGSWQVSAPNGTDAVTTTPGTGGTSPYPAGSNGGNGAARVGNNGGGGGGVGGPSGAGGAGGGAQSYYGGTANGGVVTQQTTANTKGKSGTEFDATHGCGSGGSAGTSSAQSGGYGGDYGGGSGGAWANGSAYSTGGPGLIIITYTPIPKALRVMIMA